MAHRRVLIALAALTATACGDDDDGRGSGGGSVTLVAYDSFPRADTSLNEALAEFSADSGIDVELLVAGDAGEMVSKAVLTAGNPEGDVLFGVDNTFLSRVVDAAVFEPYEAAGVESVPETMRAMAPGGVATPVDFGDVCVNYDIGWFADRDLEPPRDLAALTEAAYRDLLVVENPATSSPGLAFLLATVAEFGTDGWTPYWSDLRANGVEVVDGWNEAYYERFTWAGGPRPLVVSYGTSPPAEVVFADPPRDDAPTAAIASTCFRQVEFAGVLRGTDAPDEARALVDFLVSERFQRELPLNLFVYPANADVDLPAEFAAFATLPDEPLTVDPDVIAREREAWIEAWTELVLR